MLQRNIFWLGIDWGATDTPSSEVLQAALLLNYYEALEKASAHMLAAAQRGDWDAVVRLESASSWLISQLQHAAQVMALAAEHRPAKSALMCRILANDAEMRRLTEPWLDKLDALTGVRPRSSQ